ncbi:hypothetical protein O0L34_g4676 [Tuta absoluta]|nr:hypothetical protein O0L34_g4676 [Tuta absoluta]
MSTFRKSVLQSFKKLHRTRMRVFEGDSRALDAARLRVNQEFKKNKLVADNDAVKAMLQFAEDVEKELRTQVIQAREVKPGVFEAKITEETLRLENIPYNPNAVPDDSAPGARPCCQDNAGKNK